MDKVKFAQLSVAATLASDAALAKVARLNSRAAKLRLEFRELDSDPRSGLAVEDLISQATNLRSFDRWRESQKIEINQRLAVCLAELAEAKRNSHRAFGRLEAVRKLKSRLT